MLSRSFLNLIGWFCLIFCANFNSRTEVKIRQTAIMTKIKKGYKKDTEKRTADPEKSKHQQNGPHIDEEERRKIIEDVSETYKFIERRELTVKTALDLPALGGIYSSQLLNISKSAEPDPDGFEDMNKPDGILKLPSDGSIFHAGIPFHHFSLTALQPKHIRRLKKNGIELKNQNFAFFEDRQIRENWKSFAAAHDLPDDGAARYVGAATMTETREEHRERIQFIRQTLFRPWMCSRLLDRTAGQVFRRCYHLFHVSNVESCDIDTRIWTDEDDKQLLELVRIHGRKWEYIGNEMMRYRYHCYHRFAHLSGNADGDGTQQEEEEEEEIQNDDEAETSQSTKPEWTRVEIARLYEYLSDHLPRAPVIVALLPRFQRFEEGLNWNDQAMRLGKRTREERRKKWKELKSEFQEAKERLQTENFKEILREVIPEDTKILARAKVERRRSRKKLKPADLAKWIDAIRVYCEEQDIERLKDVDVGEVAERTQCLLGDSNFGYRWRQLRFMLFTASCARLWKRLPIEEDRLIIHLRLLAFILQHIDRMQVKKRTMRKFARRFVRLQGWETRAAIVLVDRKKENPGMKKLIKALETEQCAVTEFQKHRKSRE